MPKYYATFACFAPVHSTVEIDAPDWPTALTLARVRARPAGDTFRFLTDNVLPQDIYLTSVEDGCGHVEHERGHNVMQGLTSHTTGAGVKG